VSSHKPRLRALAQPRRNPVVPLWGLAGRRLAAAGVSGRRLAAAGGSGMRLGHIAVV
jgi:hypothetical protein